MLIMCVMKCIAFTYENSWLMKFLKSVKKMKKCVAMKEMYIFKQLIDENKQLIDERDVCLQTSVWP